MTNKMPVVGKRYKEIYKNDECKIIFINQRNIVLEYQDEDISACRPKKFFDNFEELPDQEQKLSEDISKTETTDRVSGAREELKYVIDISPYHQEVKSSYLWAKLRVIVEKAQNLLNALDAENLPEKQAFATFQQKELAAPDFKEHKPKSIWKDVSELPEDENELIDIPEFEGYYQASRDGRIYSLITKRYLRLSHNDKGYLYTNLMKDNKRTTYSVHRLIAKTFLPDYDDGLTVNHKDENKANNHYLNLECLSIADNIKYGSAIDRRAITRAMDRLEKRIRILEGKSNKTLTAHPNAKKDKK